VLSAAVLVTVALAVGAALLARDSR
jgi:hypothetical protein